MSKATVESVQEQIKSLNPGETLMVRALKTKNPNKIQIEFAEKTQAFEGNANALVSLLNADDERFNSGARRAWTGGEITNMSKVFNINFGDDADWVMDPNLGKEVLPLGVLNPTVNGFRLRVEIRETTEGTDYQLENVDSAAKRRGADGDFITHKGNYIFSNTVVVPYKEGEEPSHTILKADTVSQTETVSGDIIQEFDSPVQFYRNG
jgi:hypothetical protein